MYILRFFVFLRIILLVIIIHEIYNREMESIYIAFAYGVLV